MVGKIDLVDEQDHNSYVLKIYPNAEDDQPLLLFHCPYTDRPKTDAFKEAQDYKKQFSKTYKIPLEEDLD